MDNITGAELIRACSAIGAGLAVIAGYCSGPRGIRSRKEPGRKIRHYIHHAFGAGGSRNNWSLWLAGSYPFNVRTAIKIR